MASMSLRSEGGPLDGVCIVEIAGTPAAEFAGGLLADMGATVVKVEPPGGSPLRAKGPTLPGEDDSLLFQSENRGKSSVVVRLEDLSSTPSVRALIESADGLIEDLGPGGLEALRLDPDVLLAANAPLAILRISPYGQSGPLAGVPGDDRTAQAYSGGQFLTGFLDRPPQPITVPMADCWTGLLGAASLVAAILDARRSGTGDVIDLALYDAMLRTMGSPLAAYSREGQVTRRQGNFAMGVVPGNVYETSDGGFIAVSGAGDKPFVRLCEAIEAPNAALDPRFSTTAERRKHRDEADALVAGWIIRHTLAEVEARFTDMGVAGAVVQSVDQMLVHPHIAARGVLIPLTSTGGTPFLTPGRVPRFAGTPGPPAVRAPRLGEHTGDAGALSEALRARTRLTAPRGPGRLVTGGPLEGFRVLDLSQVLAGPFGAGLLADLGAEVTMVELPEEGGPQPRFAGGQPVGFIATNRNKASVTLDVRTPHGRAAVLDLVRVNDVLVENYRPGTLERWGIGPDVLLDANPGIVVVRASGFGQSGPYSGRSSYNPVACAFGGVTYLGGWPDRPPLRDGVTAGDYVTGLCIALGAVGGLACRDRDGRGQVVDVAMYEAALRMTGDLVAVRTALGVRRERAGGAWPAYPVSASVEAADGRCIELSADSWDEVRAVLAAVGAADAASPHQALSAFVAARNAGDGVRELRAAGARCSVVNSAADLVAEPHLWSRLNLARVDVPGLGEVVVPGPVPRFARRSMRLARWSDRRGSDNSAVLGGLLGYSASAIAEATQTGAPAAAE